MVPVIFDTREQKHWVLDPDRFSMTRGTLKTGDYTIAGLEDRFAIERKSLGDFVGTVIGDWIRFRKELYRLASFDFAAVIVEADLSDVFAHRYESEAKPESVIGRANSIYLDHGIPVLWWGSRLGGCVRMAENLFALAAKKLGGGNACHAVQAETEGADHNAGPVPRIARNRGEVHIPARNGVGAT